MTVYVTQELKGRDLSSALEFGELRVVVPASMSIRPCNIEEVQDTIIGVMSSFDARKDHILLSGDPIVMGLVWQTAVEEAWDQYRICLLRALRWDRIDSRYVEFKTRSRY
jgi:hypothetical protein